MSQNIETKITKGSARILFVADCGWDIKVPSIERQFSPDIEGKKKKASTPEYKVIPQEEMHRFPVQPLTLELTDSTPIEVSGLTSDPNVTMRITDMGAISAEVKFDLKDCTLSSVANLAHKLDEDLDGKLRIHGTRLIQNLATTVGKHITSPRLAEFETYRTFAINELSNDQPALDLLQTHRSEIAHILRAEVEKLAQEQIEDALSVAISYLQNDRAIIDTRNAVLLGNASFKDVSTVLGFAVIELVELKVLESFLKNILEPKSGLFTNNSKASGFPYKNGKFKLRDMHIIEQDVAIQLGRVMNPLDLLDDHYYADLRKLMAKRLGLSEWAEQVKEKLGVVREISNNLNERSTHRTALAVEIGVLLLVAYEVWHAAFGK